MKRILVITVTYNAMKWVDRCLGSIRTSVHPADVFVIDNGSSDGTQEYIRSAYPEVMLCDSGKNLGFGRANNVGFRRALEGGYDYVYLLNQDAWVFPDTFSRLVETMEAGGYGILSPMQLTASADKPDPRFARRCPEKALREWKAVRNGDSAYAEVHEADFVMAAHWMISRECLKTVGGFSPAFRHYGEDDNYYQRALYHGFGCGILSSAEAVHDREMRPMTKESAMRLKCVASVVKVLNPLNCLWFRLVLQPVELLLISIRYRSWAVFRYICGFVKSYPSLCRYRSESLETGAFLDSLE